MAHHLISDAQAPRLAEKDAAEVFHQVFFLAFHDQETVRDESAENEAHLFAAGVGGLWKVTLHLLERQWFEIVELLENFRHGRRGIWIKSELLPFVLARIFGFLGPNWVDGQEGERNGVDGKAAGPEEEFHRFGFARWVAHACMEQTYR